MKYMRAFRNTVVISSSGGALFPHLALMGSTSSSAAAAFVLGTTRNNHGRIRHLPVSTAAVPPLHVAHENHDEFENDFIAAATQAAVERESSLEAISASVPISNTHSRRTYEMPVYDDNDDETPTFKVASTPFDEAKQKPQEYDEYDFIETATKAAVDREQIHRNARINWAEEAEAEDKDDKVDSFVVYPAFLVPPPARAQRAATTSRPRSTTQ